MTDPLLLLSKKGMKSKNQDKDPHGKEGTQELWPEYEYRPEQEEMGRKVWDCLENEGNLLVEAGTGVGKTLAYLLPLLHFAKKTKMRVAISTETKSLQQQILYKDLPLAEKLLSMNIKAELCMGAANFVCKRRLQGALDKGDIDPIFSEDGALEEFLQWEEKTPVATRQGYAGSLPNLFWNKINRDPLDCLSSRCPHYDISPYFVARRAWQKAELLILNHSLLANHIALESKLLPEFQYLVIDEAHRFPEILQNAFTLQGSMQELRSLLNEGGAREKQIIKDLEVLYMELQTRFPQPFMKQLRIKTELPLEEAFRIINALEKIREDLEKKLNLFSSQTELELDKEKELEQSTQELQLQARISHIEDFRSLIEKLAAEKKEGEVLWLEKKLANNSAASLKDILIFYASLSGGNFLQEKLFSQLSSVIMTSATLSANPKNPFEYISKELGFSQGDEPESLCLSSPFDYKKQSLLYLPRNIADPVYNAEEEFHEDISKEIHSLLELSKGGAFVLFTSTRSLRACQKLLEKYQKEKQSYELFSQISLGPNPALQAFQKNKKKNAVLLGLATFWQGIDIPGDRLRMVIVTRIPFRSPEEPIFSARLETEEKEGGNPFFNLQVPIATLSIRQGLGRLIRSSTDKGVVAILDPRLHKRSYGKDILSVLPPAQRHSDFASLKEAYKELFSS